jgi:hypothetical protein
MHRHAAGLLDPNTSSFRPKRSEVEKSASPPRLSIRRDAFSSQDIVISTEVEKSAFSAGAPQKA